LIFPLNLMSETGTLVFPLNLMSETHTMVAIGKFYGNRHKTLEN
jgi:hypothetical protein